MKNQQEINNELNIGLTNEKKVFDYLKENNIEKNIRKSKNQFSLFDFKTNRKLIEVKSRTNKSTNYPTTIVGFNKIKHIIKYGKKATFYFLFTDGLYSWDFKEGNYTISAGGRTDRGRNEIKQYCYIDINNLIKITDEINSRVDICLID